MSSTDSPPDCSDADGELSRALAASPYVTRLIETRAGLAAYLAGKRGLAIDGAEIGALLAAETLDANSLATVLRRLRDKVFARIAVRDLAEGASLGEVTEAMSALADTTVRSALAVCEANLIETHGAPRDAQGRRQQLIVIGMGKLGGRELNVSSDIDLIFVYPDEGETAGPRHISNFEFFTRLARRLIEALAAATADGRVFRVDMRLRPNGDSGPLVVNFDMLETYFVAQGREWERYAWIKARPITGDRQADLQAIAVPFVFRKYLDYGAVNAMRELHAQIRAEVRRRDMANNVKLGPGGIREIEFIAQVFQLIRGGRDLGLRIRPTVPVLHELAARGLLAHGTVAELQSAYEFLRRLEHRLQYVEDKQTHRVPERGDERQRIVRAMGYGDDDAAFTAVLDTHRRNVTRHFEAIFANPVPNGHALEPVWARADSTDQNTEKLTRLGYRDAAATGERLANLRSGARYQDLAPVMRRRFDQLVPRLVEIAAATPNPDDTLVRGLDLLETISRRGAYLALLNEYPHALTRLADLVGASSWAADYLTHHPVLLDELLDARLIDAEPDWPAFHASLARELEGLEPDMERQMDIMREAHHAQVVRLLAQDLAGRLTVERLADHLSALADIILDQTIERVWRKIRNRHRDKPRFAVVSYGKLGGKELGYASDLDIIFLFADDAPEAAELYSRLAWRINTWLSSRTAAGILFETDLRLRPNGEAGLLVSSIDAFRRYQTEAAWVWEHQALTRARFSAGDPEIGKAFDSIRDQVLCQERDFTELRREVLAMRQRMLDAHANRSPLFDLKHDRGGLIDVEFIVQFLVLGHAVRHRTLTANRGNIALLGMAAELGLIPAQLAARVADAYRDYRRLQHGLRLNRARYARVSRDSVAAHIADVTALWQVVLGETA